MCENTTDDWLCAAANAYKTSKIAQFRSFAQQNHESNAAGCPRHTSIPALIAHLLSSSLICLQTHYYVFSTVLLLLGLVICHCFGEHNPVDYTKTRSRLLDLLPSQGERAHDHPINPLIVDGEKQVNEPQVDALNDRLHFNYHPQDPRLLYKFVVETHRRLKTNANSL